MLTAGMLPPIVRLWSPRTGQTERGGCGMTALKTMALTRWSAMMLFAVALATGPALALRLRCARCGNTLQGRARQPSRFREKGPFRSRLERDRFKRAILSGANLLGADLSDANLSFADLKGAKLDRTRLIRTNFADANLSGVSLYHAVGSLNLETSSDNAPNFARANLSGARIMARLSRANLRGADLTNARLGPPELGNELKTPQQTDLSGAVLAGADLRRANLRRVNLVFADLSGADLGDADLGGADLSHAVLTGANLAGANLEDVDLDGAVLTGVRGISSVRGWERPAIGKRRYFDRLKAGGHGSAAALRQGRPLPCPV